MSRHGGTAITAASMLLGAVAQQPSPTPTPSPWVEDEAAEVRPPRTADEHLAAADEYARQVVERRKEAARHRRMIAAYERLAADVATQPVPPRKRGATLPPERRHRATAPVAAYRAHCDSYVAGAETLAVEAERLAEFHRARARELRATKAP